MANENKHPSENCTQVAKYCECLEREAYPDPGSDLGKALSKAGLPMRSYRNYRGWEGLKGSPWTIGYGHTRGVKQGDICSEQQAYKWLQEDMEDAAALVRRNVPWEMAQGQFDALCDMAFNMGDAFMKKDNIADDFDDVLRAGNICEIRNRIPTFRKGGGVVLPGLVKRGGMRVALFDGYGYHDAIRMGEETLLKWRANGSK